MKKRKVNLRKLDSRSVKAKFIGYDSNSTAYILQELATKKIIKARNVLFEENEIQPFSPKEEIYQGEKILESPNLDLHDEQLNEKPVGDEVGEMRNEVPNVPDQVPDQPQNEEEDNEEQPLARANRNRRPPERYGNPYTFSTTQQEETVAVVLPCPFGIGSN